MPLPARRRFPKPPRAVGGFKRQALEVAAPREILLIASETVIIISFFYFPLIYLIPSIVGEEQEYNKNRRNTKTMIKLEKT